MPSVYPVIPESIVVHLGAPTAYAENVTVAFPDYIKNVVCSEIYPTWEESAIVANTLAIISFALNRVYTEYYPSRGYSFNITNSTAIDQKYIQGRSLFENVVQIVDEIFNSYLRYAGFIEPLAAKFCNGTTSTCDGLSQWGSQGLAQNGATTAEILRNYYGDNIEIVRNVPVEDVGNSYPGSPLRQGDIGQNVSRIQIELNRISQNYPAIPKVEMDGVFGPATDAAVRAFQSIFSLTVDGIVGQATWYKLILLYVAVNKLGELRSEGQTFLGFSWEYPESIEPGETGGKVTHLQYMLSVIAEFIPEVPAPDHHGPLWRGDGAGRRGIPDLRGPRGDRDGRPRNVGRNLRAVSGHPRNGVRRRGAVPVLAVSGRGRCARVRAAGRKSRAEPVSGFDALRAVSGHGALKRDARFRRWTDERRGLLHWKAHPEPANHAPRDRGGR